MLATLPPEILDLIVDNLCGEPPTLKACCVVSKSWVPRARRYLFADIKFSSPQPSFQSWMEAFPNPSNSPAHHTRSLSIHSLPAINYVASAALRAWTYSFHHIIQLEMNLGYQDRWVSLVQLHGLSSTLKSLRLHYSSIQLSEVLNLIRSFPLLEDLWLQSNPVSIQNDDDEWDTPPTSPKFTGSLYLSGEIHAITRKLLDLPGGLHFTKISTFCSPGDVNSTMDLVSRCSDTLESLRVYYSHPRASPSASVVINTSPSTVGQGYRGCHLYLTSPRPHNSNIWSFGGPGRRPSGSPRRSKLPSLKTCSRLSSFPPLASLLGRQFVGNGRTSITCWPDSGPHVRFFRRSDSRGGGEAMTWETRRQVCCLNSPVWDSSESLEP